MTAMCTACRADTQLPIAYLRSHNISVRSRLVDARSAPPLAGMTFAYVDPGLDVDVSRQIEATGVVEIGISQVSMQVEGSACLHLVQAGCCTVHLLMLAHSQQTLLSDLNVFNFVTCIQAAAQLLQVT